MAIVTLPKKITSKETLVAVSQKEYEEFSQWKKALRIRVVMPTPIELRAIKRGRKEIRGGKYVEWRELKRELARNRR